MPGLRQRTAVTAAAIATVLGLSSACGGAEPERRPNYFRGVFTTDKGTYSLQIFHDKIDSQGKTQSIAYHAKLEQGCQVYEGKGTFIDGSLLLVARSIYLADGETGLGHFDLFSVVARVDNQGQIDSALIILPDGRQYKLAYDLTTPPIELKGARTGARR